MSGAIDRRRFLLGAAGIPIGAMTAQGSDLRLQPAQGQGQIRLLSGPAPQTTLRGVQTAPSTTTGPMQADVTIGGRTFTFQEVNGSNLGNFEGPGFVQRCVRVTRPDTPLTVYFRPDLGSGRVEVV